MTAYFSSEYYQVLIATHVYVRPTDEADIDQQRRQEAARLFRDRHHVSNDDTINDFEDLSVIGGDLETIEQVIESIALCKSFYYELF